MIVPVEVMGSGADHAAPDIRMLGAFGSGQACDFTGRRESTSEGERTDPQEMARWGAERTVSGELLSRLLRGQLEVPPPEVAILRGAVVDGVLDLEGAIISTELRLEHCRIGGLRLGGATFTRDTGFRDTVFLGDAWFDRVTFGAPVRFDGALFRCDARFDRATFVREVRFGETSFAEAAVFTGTVFAAAAWFGETTFAGDTLFGGATFAASAWFGSTEFTDDVRFDGTIFGAEATFREARFTGPAEFRGAAFLGEARFGEATFGDEARFDEAVAMRLDFTDAHFDAGDLGTFAVENLVLDSAVFHRRTRMTVVATRVSCRHTQLRAGGHLWIHAAELDLAYAEFLGRTILTEPGARASPLGAFGSPGPRPDGFFELPARQRAEYVTRRDAHELGERLRAQAPGRTGLTSMRRANVTELTVSALRLDLCQFAGAHGLDRLRVDATCSFLEPPRGWRVRRPLRFTPRRMIGEEATWRKRYAHWWDKPAADDPTGSPAEGPSALEIAGIYRDLRKGLEDTKNEPGAADFYYGEMEMRRLAFRESRAGTPGGPAGVGRPSSAERWLLHAYWAISGYGLRAARASTAFVAVILAAAWLFATVGVDRPAVSFSTALEFATRDSLALLRTPTPELPLTGAGVVVDIVLRVLGPLLVGLALLAIRGRTRR